MKLRLAAIAFLPLTLAACDEAAMADFQAGLGIKPAAEAEAAPEPTPLRDLRPPEVSPLQQPIEVAGAEQVAVPTADAATYQQMAFTARGNEPFWSADVAGNTLTYKTPENPAGRKISVNRLVFAKGVEYVGVLGEAAFALTIRGTDCTDDMSGEKFPMTATLRVGSRVSNGCAAPAQPASAAAEGEA